MKKITLFFVVISIGIHAHAQDTAAINTLWPRYAGDTSLTYQQIVTICDSMFAAAGYPVFPDSSGTDNDSTTNNDSVQNNEQIESEDGKPFYDYSLWKTFYATRLDVATGKPHDFALAASGALSSSSSPSNCRCYPRQNNP